MVKEVAYIAYYVRDVPQARRFYTEVLWLKPGEWFNDQWIEFDLGEVTFALDGTGDELGITPGTSTGVTFEVDDIQATRQRLEDAGAQPTELKEFPACRAFVASDPEGNRFVIHQRKTEG